MGAVEDRKGEDLNGEVEFVVELDRKIPAYCPYCDVEMAPTTINVKRKSSVKLMPISKDEFLLKFV